MNKLNFIIITLLSCFFGYAQENELTDDQKDFLYDFLYDSSKELFQTEKKYAFKSIDFNLNDRFPKVDKDSVSIVIDSIKTNAKLYFDEDEHFGKRIAFSSRFPYLISSDYLRIELSECTIKDELNRSLELVHNISTNWGGGSHFEYRNGVNLSYDYQTINIYQQIEEYDSNSSYKGSATYDLSYIDNYEFIELNKKDVGKTFQLNHKEYVLVDVFQNKVVLEEKSSNSSNESTSLKLINLNDDASKEYVSPSLFEYYSTENEDEIMAAYDSRTINKKVYQVFKEEPEISLEKFKEIIPLTDSKNFNNNSYIVFLNPVEVNNFILYIPVFSEVEKLKLELTK